MPAFSVTPTSLQAGSHPDVTIHAEFSGGEHVRDLTISLPAGLVGDPTSKPRCAQAAFQADTCPANTRVGTTSVRTVIPPLQILPIAASGDVYNVVPGAGEPARLGVVVRPPGASKVFIASPVRIRPSDGGLDSVITNMPSTVSVAGIPVEMFIEAMDLTLNTPFVSLPTSCKPAQARIAAVSAAGTAVSRQAAPFTPTGCDKVPFAPRLEATINASRTPSLQTVITVPRGHASTASAAVTLPRGVSVNANALRDTCTLAEQAAGPCPARARVGGAVARTPLLADPLAGPVLLASIPGQQLPGLRLELSGGASLALTGTVTGRQIRTEFAGIPDVPLERFELTFDANRSLTAQKDFCRGPQPTIAAELTGHNGAVARLDRAARRDRLRPPRRHADGRPAPAEAPRRGAARAAAAAREAHPPARRATEAHGGGAGRRPPAAPRARPRDRHPARRRAPRRASPARLNRRLRNRKVVVETLDTTGRVVRQRLRARG